MSEEEIIKMYDKGIVEIAPIMEKLIENFKQDKNIIDIQQCQLIIHYLLAERKFDEKYIDELEKKLDKEKEKNKNSVSKDEIREKINFLKEVLAFAETGRDEKATIQANLLKNIIIEMEKLLED